MQDSVRILVVEHRHSDHGMARQLLTEFDLDFQWQSVASPRELRTVAKTFGPAIVLCAGDGSMSPGYALLDAIRLLCARAPSILVSSVRSSVADFANETERFLSARHRRPELGPQESTANACSAEIWQDKGQLRQRFASILDSRSEPLVLSDSDGWITHANTSACHQLAELHELSLGTLLTGPAAQWARAPHWLDAARDANQGNDQYSGPFCATQRNVRIAVGEHRLAYFDSRTGRPTRVHIDGLIRSMSARARGRRTAFALVAAGLNPDQSSAEACVAALCRGSLTINSDLLSAATCYGSVARISADEFLLVLPSLACPADAAITVQGILDSIHIVEDVSLGVPDLKSAPPIRHRSHTESRAAAANIAAAPLEIELGDALQRRALSVQYQPQYELKTGRGCGVEALARWVLSTGEIIPPSVFIPVAERAGMIRELGAWVLQSACEAAVGWYGRPRTLETLSVNVSALQIDRDFCSVIGRTLKRYGFPANQLELEITESALIANTDLTIEYLQDWKRLGVRIAVDDFGTGYSSLSYLSRLPIDRLKLDQSLVHMMTQNSKSAAVMRSVVLLGAELGIDVIAEGVETEVQFQMLADLGCPRVQGYLLGRPMPASQARVVLGKTWGNRPAQASSVLAARAGVHAH